MTEQELNSVRELKKRIRDLESHLQSLRTAAENLTPILDGLPHSTERKSRVEKIALMIVEDTRELESLRKELIPAKSKLADIILREVEDITVQTLLVLRYVECCPVKEVARRMQYSVRAVFKMHAHFLKEFIRGHTRALLRTF